MTQGKPSDLLALERTKNTEDPPIYFHLLSEAELQRLSMVAGILEKNSKGVLAKWFDLYTVHFGEDRTFSEAGFVRVWGQEFRELMQCVIQGDLVRLSKVERHYGRILVEAGVPFDEVVSSMHLFEESCAPFYRKSIAVLARGIDLPMIFDKLSHVRVILLAEAYFGEHQVRQNRQVRHLESELKTIDPNSSQRQSFHGLVGKSTAMRQLYFKIQRAGESMASILITGSSGTGKELIARAAHECSTPNAPFVAVNCAALPRELIESELFGHKRGAFSGATHEYLGLVRSASGGTLFLDEITEMPIETQAKLLRILEDKVVRPVGGREETRVDVRFISSSNRDPKKAIEDGYLREDLFFRLKVHGIEAPSLFERKEDIRLLVDHFVEVFNDRYPRTVRSVEAEVYDAFEAYPWPGNVRELMNAIEVAFAYGRTDVISREDIPREISGLEAVATEQKQVSSPQYSPIPTFEESERILLARALDHTRGNKLQAAKLLGISRKQLYAKIYKYEIS